ncbi:MAG: hypothetical protein HON90_16160 [Halobacteriovoraceae bacterium]|nr:hypothetical protein [Halobacteriovoraceae bacterium]
MNKKTVLHVGFPSNWGTLIPSLQHTGYADAIMANQFEALVTTGQGGTTKPLAAKSWKVSDDSRIFTFIIDTDKYFSSGKQLSAKDFKRSWEHGLSLSPKSANSSLLDVMYKVVGFKEFKKKGTLDGVRVINENTLEVEFQEPFRMALNHLAGSRMSAFVIEGDKYIGTGPYVIKEEKSRLILSKNLHSNEDIGFSNIEVKVVQPSEATAALENGIVDVYALAEFAHIGECLEENKNIACFSGSEARHQTLMLNGMNGRFFENKNHRLAIQAMVYKHLQKDILPTYHKYNLNIDPQIYLPLQMGRIDDSEAENLINIGNDYIKELVKASQKTPIFFVTSEETNWLFDILKSEGVLFDEKSGHINTPDRIKMYYKTYDADIIVMPFSVASGDPDGIYHTLGKSGSISSPIQFRKSVSDLLEEGRKIINLSEADLHYKKVSIETLKEVPFVHIGFTKSIVAYRKDVIKIKGKLKKRDESRFSIFEAN